MKIERIRRATYAIPLDPPFRAAWDPKPRTRFSATIVTVVTDDGIKGIGSGDAMAGFDEAVPFFWVRTSWILIATAECWRR